MGNTVSTKEGLKKKRTKRERIEKFDYSIQRLLQEQNEVVNLSYMQIPNVHELVEETLNKQNLKSVNWVDLKLDLNGITVLSPTLFTFCSNLTYLSLRYNKLNTIPPELCEALPKLRVLNVSNNPLLNGLPENFGSLKNLVELHCCNTVMKMLPFSIGDIATLEVIDLFNSNLVELPKELGKLSKLRRLDLANNYLSSLPNDLVGLQSLEYLNLNNNSLSELPVGFGAAVSKTLTQLHMARCAIDDGDVVDDDDSIKNLIDEMVKMTALIKLDLSRNKLTKVPRKFLQPQFFKSLRKLNLSHNPLVIVKSRKMDDDVLALKDRLDVLVIDVDSHNIHNKMVRELNQQQGGVSALQQSLSSSSFSISQSQQQQQPLSSSSSSVIQRTSSHESSPFMETPSSPRSSAIPIASPKLDSNPVHNSGSYVFSTSLSNSTPLYSSTNVLATSSSSYVDAPTLRHSTDAFRSKKVLTFDEFVDRDQQRFENSVRIPFLTKLSHEEMRDRIKGCIFGAAIGDAIGLATEFLSKIEAQFHYYGEPLNYSTFIRDRHRSAFTPGDWTDDTDQLIIIMDCILSNNEDEEDIQNRGNTPLVTQQQFAAGLQRWAKTGFRDELGDSVGQGIGQTVLAVVTHPSFLENPQSIAEMAWKQGDMNVASNGALMRTAILGIPYFYNLEKVAAHTKQLCRTTHYDDRCVASCLALVTAIALLMRGEDIVPHTSQLSVPTAPVDWITDQALAVGRSAVKDKHVAELEEYMRTKDFRKLKLEEENSRGYTYKTLGAAFGCFYEQYRDNLSFKEIITNVIMEGGDADSNGCVAGALIGCRIGYNELPEDWVNNLIHKEWLEQKVDRFLQILGL